MHELRRAHERGPTNFGWLDSRHSFSFGAYYDPRHAGFRDLLVINEDRVAPGAGFAAHDHRDMEILSYVIAGALKHRDSLGNGSIIRPGEIQRMSAGTGIRHSEDNASDTEAVHFLQIWVRPQRLGLPPGYEQKSLPTAGATSRLDLIGAESGGDSCVTIHQDVNLWRAVLAVGHPGLALPIVRGRYAWVQAVRGQAVVNGVGLNAGDGLKLSDEAEVTMHALTPAELLIFDLA